MRKSRKLIGWLGTGAMLFLASFMSLSVTLATSYGDELVKNGGFTDGSFWENLSKGYFKVQNGGLQYTSESKGQKTIEQNITLPNDFKESDKYAVEFSVKGIAPGNYTSALKVTLGDAVVTDGIDGNSIEYGKNRFDRDHVNVVKKVSVSVPGTSLKNNRRLIIMGTTTNCWGLCAGGVTDFLVDNVSIKRINQEVSYNDQGVLRTETVIHGRYAGEPTSLPQKDGHEFVGWRKVGESQNFDFRNTPITEDITLEAVFRDIKAPTITLKDPNEIWVNKGEPFPVSPSINDVDVEDNVTVKNNINVSISPSSFPSIVDSDMLITYTATDEAGNKASVKKQIRVNHKPETPSISVNIQDAGKEKPKFTFSFKDDTYGLQQATAKLYKGNTDTEVATEIFSLDGSSAEKSWEVEVDDVNKADYYKIVLSVTDKGGLTSEEKILFYPPTVNFNKSGPIYTQTPTLSDLKVLVRSPNPIKLLKYEGLGGEIVKTFDPHKDCSLSECEFTDITLPNPGAFDLKVIATDTIAEGTNSIRIIYDTSKPADPEFTSPHDEDLLQNSKSLSFERKSIADNGEAGLSGITYTLKKGEEILETGIFSQGETSYIKNITDDGEYTLTLQSEDKAGNKSDEVTSKKIIVDTQAPVIENQTFYLFKGQISVHGDLKLISDDASAEFSAQGFPSASVSISSDGKISGIMLNQNLSADVTARDQAGNESRATLELKLVSFPEKVVLEPKYYGENYSNEEAIAALKTKVGSLNLGDDYFVNWQIADFPTSGGDESLVPVTITNKYGQTTVLDLGVSFIYKKPAVVDPVPELYFLDVADVEHFIDRTGVYGIATVAWKTQPKNTQNPTIINDAFVSRNAIVKVTYTDSHIEEVKVKLNRKPQTLRNDPQPIAGVSKLKGTAITPQELVSLQNSVDNPQYTREGMAPSTTISGTQTTQVRVTYADGSRDIVNVKFKVRELTGEISGNPTAWTNQSVTLILKTSEPVETPAGRTEISKIEFSKLIDVNEDGIVTFTTGAVSSLVKYKVEKIDKEAPANLILSVDGADIVKEASVKFNISATDTASGIKEYQCKLNDGSRSTCPNPAIITNLKEGTNSISMRAMDNAGNISPETTTDVTKDSLPPEIAPIRDIILKQGETLQTVTTMIQDSSEITDVWGEGLPVGLTTGVAYLTTSHTQVSFTINGTSSQIGEYPITIYAKDKLGNQTSSSFHLKIVDDQAPKIEQVGDISIRRGRIITPIVFKATDNHKIKKITITGLPAGLSYATGVVAPDTEWKILISGKATKSGTFPIIATIRDEGGLKGEMTFSIKVRASSSNGGSSTPTDTCPNGDHSGSTTDGRCNESPTITTGNTLPQQPNGNSTGLDTQQEKSDSTKEIKYEDSEIYNPTIEDGKCYTRRPLDAILDSTKIITAEEFKKAQSFLWSYEMTKFKDVDGFDPYRNLSRQEAAKMFSNFAMNVLCRKPDLNLHTHYSDTTNANSTLKPYIELAYQLGIMKGSGKGDGEFRPFDAISKAEVNAVLIRMILKSYLPEKETIGEKWYDSYNKVATSLSIINQGAGMDAVSRHNVSLMLFRAYKNQVFEWRNIDYFSYVLEKRDSFVK